MRQSETAPPTKRSYEIEQEEKKWEEIAGKKKREIYMIKKYLMTKNHPGDKSGQEMEEPIGNVELACKPANAGLVCKPANVLGEESEQVLEEPGDNAW